MSVNVLVGPPAYNKAPSPAKTPTAYLYPTKIVTEGGQLIWVSIPQPDKLHLTVRLSPEHFVKSYKVGHPHEYGRMVMQALATGHVGAVIGTKYVQHAQLFTSVQVLVGEGEQPVYFRLSRTVKDAEGPHTLAIELNPKRMTEEGHFELLDRLRTATSKRLLVGAMLADAKVSRLDVAVDIVGVEVSDLLVRLKGAGKRNHRSAASGKLETIELWSSAAKSSRKSTRAAIVYDKRAESIAAGREPPHYPAPFVRVERTKKRFGNKPMLLVDLPSLPNVLADLAVGTTRAAAEPLSTSFLRYAELRRTKDTHGAIAFLGLAGATAAQFETWLQISKPDVLDGNKAWGHWKDGLKATGAYLLVEAAATKSAGVPLPPEDE